MSTEMIELEVGDGIGVLRLNRPPANAIELELAGQFSDALAAIEENAAIRALVLTGAGRCFSAGQDLKVVPAYNAAEQRAMILALSRMLGRLYGLGLPVVAAVNGHAIAGGLILALACDYRLGADADYKLGLSEARVGFPFPVVPMAIVQAEMAAPAARIAALLARNTGPREALAQGALDELCPPELLLSRAREMAQEMAGLPRSVYGRIKRQLRAAALARIEDVLQNENDPMLAAWLDAETAAASANVLRHKSEKTA